MELSAGGRFLLEMLFIKPKTILKQVTYDIPAYFFLYWEKNIIGESKTLTPTI